MSEPSEIFHLTTRELLKDSFWSSKKVAISGGGTIEKIGWISDISQTTLAERWQLLWQRHSIIKVQK